MGWVETFWVLVSPLTINENFGVSISDFDFSRYPKGVKLFG